MASLGRPRFGSAPTSRANLLIAALALALSAAPLAAVAGPAPASGSEELVLSNAETESGADDDDAVARGVASSSKEKVEEPTPPDPESPLVTEPAPFATADEVNVPRTWMAVEDSTGEVLSGLDDTMEPSAAIAEGGGSISGTVTDEAGLPLEGVLVTAMSFDYGDEYSTFTANNGTYTIAGLPDGPYGVLFEDHIAGHIAEVWDNQAPPFWEIAKVFYLQDQESVTGIDAALALGGTISGMVVNQDGDPLTGICVSAYSSSANGWGGGCTDATGYFQTTGLPTAADYRVTFRDSVGPHMEQYYQGTTDSGEATLVEVTVGVTTGGIGATMVRGGSFSGVVTDASTETPIEGAEVTVYDADGNWHGSRSTNVDGGYTTPGLDTGTYWLAIATPSSMGYLREYYDDAADPASAIALSLTMGEDVTGIDVGLQLGGMISGVVSDAESGSPIPNGCVSAFDSGTGEYVIGTCADGAGAYLLRGLRTGSYSLEFGDHSGGHLSSWYLDQETQAMATPVEVVEGQVTAGINQGLVLGGSITGTLTDAIDGGPAVTGVHAYAVGSSNYLASGYADETGAYTVQGLPAGDYEVHFGDWGESKYRETWFDGGATRAEAAPVSVELGETTSGIDQALLHTGSIAGRLTNGKTDEPVEGAWVSVYDLAGSYRSSTHTDSDGNYTAWGLTDGEYMLRFEGRDLPPVWYDTKPTMESATLVTVQFGVATTGIDQAMPVGGRITGVVTDEVTGEQIPHADLRIRDAWGNVTYGWGGTFDILVLPGDYTVEALSQNHTSEYFDNVRDPAEATVLTIADDETVTLEIALTPNPAISGTITDESGNPVYAGVELRAASNTSSAVAYAESDATTGEYRITAPPGQYVLHFRHYETPATLLSEFYNDRATAATADVLRLDAGVDHTNVDAVLELGGFISGTVTRPAGTTVYVYIRSVETGEHMNTIYVGSDGTWRSQPLAPGTYTVQFYAWDGSTSQSVWYDGATAQSDATPIEVVAGETTAGIDMTFVGADTDITGRVTVAATGQPRGLVNVYVFTPGARYEVARGRTDGSGIYAVSGLEPGTYEVYFQAEDWDAVLRNEWYQGSPTRDGATPVVVTGDEPTSGIDAALTPGGSISGRIVDDVTGLPVMGCAHVTVWITDGWGTGRSACTDTQGNYRIGGLATGGYKVEFSSETHVDEYWDNASYSDATLVDVIDGEDTPGIDAALTLGGSISGRVVDAATGLPLSNIHVYASGASWESDNTGTDGRFTITGLAAGDHRVEFDNYNGRYLTQWYDDARTYDTATLVTVELGKTVEGIDAAMRLTVVDSSMGSVFGVVTDAVSGDALEGICAYLYQDGSYTGMGTCTEADGWYELQGVQPGTYEVGFSDPSGLYETQYSDPVEVVAGAGSEVPMAMGAIRTVAGLVTDAGTGEPLEGVCAYLYEQGTWNTVGASCTAEDGRIVMQDVPTGTYELAFADTAGTHHTQWYSGATSRDAATPITVDTGTIITDANAAMAPITSVIGLVTDEQTGELLEGVCAYLYPVGSDSSVIGSCTEADGRIVMQGMAPGSYELAFADTTALHATEWFGDSATRDAAATIELNEGTIVTDAHAAMAPITTVVGHVTDSASGDPLTGVCAYLYPVGSEESAGASCTVDDGRIAIQGFPQGEYVIGFADTSGLRATEWYGGSYNRADATVIDLTTAWARLDLDVAMDFTGSVTGLVTDELGEPRADVCVYAGNLDGTYTGIGSCTDATGSFTLMGLNPVDVKLGYYPPGMDSPTTWWYDAQTSEETATPVTVPAGAVATLTTQSIPR